MVGYASAGKMAFGGRSTTAAFATGFPPIRADRVVNAAGQPQYQIASVDLSTKWVDLVAEGKVATTVNLSTDDESSGDVAVRYGVRLATTTKGSEKNRCEEFVEEAGMMTEDGATSSSCKILREINATLTALQQQEGGSTSAVKFIRDGDFAAQLQLVRTLRPAPSPGFAASSSTTSTCTPPPYDASTDSFVTGPLRLELRPLVATLTLPSLATPWDVFHNVSPADTRGHFLLLPTLSEKDKNWRGQSFTPEDCNDLVHLANSIHPVGSLLLGYNSVGAGASQNHIHCHAWPSPPIPLIASDSTDDDDDNGEGVNDGWDSYAVSKVTSIYDFYDIDDGKVEISYLKYPVFCVQLSASEEHLELLGKALAAALEMIGEAPYNIGFMNRRQMDDHDHDEEEEEQVVVESSIAVDAFLFVRSKERSSVLPLLKLGISEMMGVFHAQSEAELKELTTTPPSSSLESSEESPIMMARALEDVSFDAEEELWDKIKTRLTELI
jgi:hypothetical protein